MNRSQRPQSLPRLLSVTQAAEILACCPGHTYGLIASGELSAVELKASGGRPFTRVYEDESRDFILRRTRNAKGR